ncbi:MAG: polyphosphate kinase 2 family protein [Chloroflexi bacterium]|nr:polyphosphate kinase 2 family protein [Chloroflexota bacterium]
MAYYPVKLGQHLNLNKVDANECSEFTGDKETAQNKMDSLIKDLDQLQELLYAEHKHKILIVLQGMDTSGKDGTIRHVFSGVNPQGVRVANFKEPTPLELAHDYLWRVHQQTPGSGEIVIFNRSHYEDVLIVRVHGIITPKECRRRYADINAFETMLTNEGTLILKFFLHIDKDEQRKRLQDRLDDKDKHWKFNTDDLKERARWDDYMEAYEDALSATSTDCAPWYLVPANRKWYRNLLVLRTLVQSLRDLKMAYPKAQPGLDKIVIDGASGS